MEEEKLKTEKDLILKKEPSGQKFLIPFGFKENAAPRVTKKSSMDVR